jgi:hypothetical protein
MKQEDLAIKAVELVNKTKDLGVYRYSATRHKSASLDGIRIEVRSQKLLYGVLAFVVDYEIFEPDIP